MRHFKERIVIKKESGKSNAGGWIYTLKCVECSKHFKIRGNNFNQGQGLCCSKGCRKLWFSHTRRGKNSPHWKGGIRNHGDGYITVLFPNHPCSNARGYIFRSRLIMEKSLGRYLNNKELVHHINFEKSDDTLGNLYLCKNNSKHQKVHSSLGYLIKSLLAKKIIKFENGIYKLFNN